MLQALIVVAPSSSIYTVSTVLSHKYGGANFSVTNFMSWFSMVFLTKATVELANENMGHAQIISIIIWHFTNCIIIYLVVPVYYFPGHRYNTISSVVLNFYVGFQNAASKPLEHCDFIGPQGHSWISPYQTQNNLFYLQI